MPDPVTPPTAFQRWKRWVVGAPDNYRWTLDEVWFEKNQSFLSGMIAGTISTNLMTLLVAVILNA